MKPGKFAARFCCLSAIDGESSITNSRSTLRLGASGRSLTATGGAGVSSSGEGPPVVSATPATTANDARVLRMSRRTRKIPKSGAGVVVGWRVLASNGVTSGTTSAQDGSGPVHHVLLLGPDDDARRALHLLLDRVGKQVAAVAELEGARSYLG